MIHDRPGAPAGPAAVLVIAASSALDRRPGLCPGRVVLADGATVVAAVLRRRRPVGDLVGIGLIERVVGGAVVLVHRLGAGPGLRRGLTEVLGDLGVRGRRDDP